MRLKVLSILLVLVMLLTLVPNMGITAFAADNEIASGDINDGEIHWSINSDGKLIITNVSGDGVMPDYRNTINIPWINYYKQITKVIVEEGITHIGNYSFAGLNYVTAVDLANDIETIGDEAFRSCNNLKTITIPEGVTTIEKRLFSQCNSLETVLLPTTVRFFEESAFSGCNNLIKIKIPEGVQSFSIDGLYMNCSSLKYLHLPSTITELGAANMFFNTNVENVYYEGTLSQWCNIQFCDYDNALPMSSMCNLYIDGELASNITIPSTMTKIPNYVFNNTSLSSVTIPTSVNEIGKYTFSGSSVSAVRMADTVTKIGMNAFNNCNVEKLYYVGNSDNWNNIDWGAGNENIQNIEPIFVSSFSDIHTVSVGDFKHGKITLSDNNCIQGDVITVSAKPEKGYKLKNILVNGVAIENNSFIAEGNIDYVVTAEFELLTDEIIDYGTCGDYIDWYLFNTGELFITGIGNIPNYRDYSPYYAPWYNSKNLIKTVVVDNGIRRIGDNALNFCSTLESIVLPEGVNSIGSRAFYECSKLKSVVIPETVNKIEYNAFGNCSSLESIIIPNTVKMIENSTFYACSSLKYVTISNGTETIDSSAFRNCSSLESIVIPESIKTIGNYAFCGCQKLNTVYYNGDISNWCKMSFGDESNILYNADNFIVQNASVKDLDFPENVTSIPDYAFYGFRGFDSVKISSTVRTIGVKAFSACNLPSIEFEGDAPQIGNYSFGYTNNDSDSTILYYHSGKNGWTSPTWNNYYTACIDEPDSYSVLDENNRNSQNILFTLNETAKTASVGDGNENGSGYYGAQKGNVVIPDTVTKDGVTYDVIGISKGAFYGNKRVSSVEIGSKVTSIMPSAFYGCPNIESFDVNDNNEFYTSTNDSIFDKSMLYLYFYPGGKTDKQYSVPDSVLTIGQYAFCDNKYIEEIYVGNNVESIFTNAFSGVENLKKITLPFIGNFKGSNEDYTTFRSVFGSGRYNNNPVEEYYYNDTRYDGSLETVVINDDFLPPMAFEPCYSLKSISFSEVPEVIPYRCFFRCESLEKISFPGIDCDNGELVLPEGILEVSESAFGECKCITSVYLPSTLEYINSKAFSNSGLESFSVNDNNNYYSTDSNGVLYNKNKTTLVSYPSLRPWPYYNVLDTTTTISYGAFDGCNKLFNMYIPNSVTDIEYLGQCDNLTICCYKDSNVSKYALKSNVPYWYMDNKTLQGIRVYSLPEVPVLDENDMNLDGLYIVGDYGGKELQIDNYTLSYDNTCSGKKTVTVEYNGKTTTFEIFVIVSDNGEEISFTCDKDMEGMTVYIALYDENGAMLLADTAYVSNGRATIVSSGQVYDKTDRIKMFVMDSTNFTPVGEAKEKMAV